MESTAIGGATTGGWAQTARKARFVTLGATTCAGQGSAARGDAGDRQFGTGR